MPRKDVMEWLAVAAAGCVVVVMLVEAAAFGLFPFQQRIRLSAAIERLDKIESQLAANEGRFRKGELNYRALAALDRRVSDLDTRVRYPRYARHYDGCRQCRGDATNEEGGPPSLCEEGFEVWKSDMRAEKDRASPATDKPKG
jgi:hypothetical protein